MSLVCVIQQQTSLGDGVVSPVGTQSRQSVWFCSALARLQRNYLQNTDILSLSVRSVTCTVTPLLLLHSLFFFTMAAGETISSSRPPPPHTLMSTMPSSVIAQLSPAATLCSFTSSELQVPQQEVSAPPED